MSLATPLEKAMDESYHRWYQDSRSLLKYPQEIISFVDSCGFDSEQLWRIIRGIEELKPSDDEWESIQDQFDRSEAQNGQY